MKEMNEISEDTVVGLSLKTIAAIIGVVSIVTLGYFDLQAEIKKAKELPVPVISRTEYDLKDELVRETIMNTQSDVEDIKKQLDKIEERLFELFGTGQEIKYDMGVDRKYIGTYQYQKGEFVGHVFEYIGI